MNTFRKVTIYIFFFLLFAVALFRLTDLTLINNKVSKNKYISKIKRGTIFDVNNQILSISEKKKNIYINLNKVQNKDNLIVKLKSLIKEFNLNEQNVDFNQIINNNNKVILFAYLIKINSKKFKKYIIKNFKTGQILLETVYKRVYPYNKLLCDIIGFVGRDNIGLSGIEYYYDNDLVGKKKINNYIPPYDLKLTIDIEVQKIVQNLLEKYSKFYNAKSSIAIIQNAKTGSIIALADYPYFNPNKFKDYNINNFINTAVSEYFEPGSTFKIITSAFLLNNNLISDSDTYTCTGSLELINGEIIKCTGVHGKVNLRDIIKYSCNSGMIQTMARVKPLYFYNFLKSVNFSKKTGIDLPGEIRGKLPIVKNWGIRTRATIPIGQAIGVTGVQLISAFSSLINGGTYYAPHVLKYKLLNNNKVFTNHIIKLNQIIKKKISIKLRNLLKAGVEKGSTGHRAYSKYLDIGGKTGTAQISGINIPGYLKDSYNSIFLGGFPINDPKYSILIVLYKLKKNYYGGISSAPLFKDIAQNVALYYNIIPKSKIVNINVKKKFLKRNENIISGNYDIVPNFKNMTLRQTIQILLQLKKRYNTKYIIIGNGKVSKQNIKPGLKMKTGMKLILTFKL